MGSYEVQEAAPWSTTSCQCIWFVVSAFAVKNNLPGFVLLGVATTDKHMLSTEISCQPMPWQVTLHSMYLLKHLTGEEIRHRGVQRCSKLPMLPVATLGGEPPILCFNYVCPIQPFCEVTASSVPSSAAQCQRAVRSRQLAREGFGAAVETVGVSRAVLGGCHAVTPAQGTSLVRTGLEMGVTWASPPVFSHS